MGAEETVNIYTKGQGEKLVGASRNMQNSTKNSQNDEFLTVLSFESNRLTKDIAYEKQ